jgi:hypothetical protein
MNNLIEKALKKFPKARRVAVENFTSGYDSFDMAAQMNLDADIRCYKWNAHTVNAILYVLNNKSK